MSTHKEAVAWGAVPRTIIAKTRRDEIKVDQCVFIRDVNFITQTGMCLEDVKLPHLWLNKITLY